MLTMLRQVLLVQGVVGSRQASLEFNKYNFYFQPQAALILRIRANFLSLSLKSPSSYTKKTKGKKKERKHLTTCYKQVYFAAKYEIRCGFFFFFLTIPYLSGYLNGHFEFYNPTQSDYLLSKRYIFLLAFQDMKAVFMIT